MTYMLIFLVICLCIGLWAPPKAKAGGVIVALAVALVLLFYFSPHRM